LSDKIALVAHEGSSSKKIVILAGPNGAGKTTFAREYLPQEADCPTFINADLIAAGLSPFQPNLAAIRAGRLMLEELDRYSAEGRSFAFETTLSGLTYVRRIAVWRAAGYNVKLIYLGLSSPDEAVNRVARRVSQGGHDIPESTIRRRFAAGLKNFLEIYRHRVDYWLWLDNSSLRPVLKKEGHNP
jgi:predicted ABC-type ATPase